MTEVVLSWQNVSFSIRHGFFMKKKNIIHGLSLDVVKGTSVGLVGPNGAGKTTTIKLGSGLLPPDTGEIFIKNSPVFMAGNRSYIGLLTESQYIYPYLKLCEWLTMLAGISGLNGKKQKHRVDYVMDLFQLRDISPKKMHILSKGQIQRAGLAQAFLHEPEILILDEPMSGLDPLWRHNILDILFDYKKSGGTILFSSHIISDVEKICDKIVLIENGRLCWEGNINDLTMEINGYEVVCHTDHPEVINKIVTKEDIISLPGNNWRFTIPVEKKEDLFKLVASYSIVLESFNPIHIKIEDIIFSFSDTSNNSTGN